MADDQIGTVPGIALGVCWLVFAVVWVAGAIYNRRRGPATTARAGLPSTWWLILAGYVVLNWVIPAGFWAPLTVRTGWLQTIGLVVLVGSLAFTLWARYVLGTMWTSSAQVKQDHRLHTDGPYRITRHPIYTGLLGMLAGTAMTAGLGRFVVMFLLLLALFVLKIRAEERLLDAELGEEYADYRRRVPGLFPLPRPRAGV